MPVLPQPQPNISVIIRSMDRPCLADALASVLASTDAAPEILLVNARGGHHGVPDAAATGLLQIVNQDGPALDRAAAANAGLLASRGEKLLFLDDDDLVDPDHLSRLASALEQAPADTIAVYTGVRLQGAPSEPARELNEPWSADRLAGMNFLPIHAVMFRAAPVRGKLAFDPALSLLEDWDFWRRLAGLGSFLQLPGCSATYRLDIGQSGLSAQRNLDALYAAHDRILRKALDDSPLAISRSLFWFDTALRHLEGEKATQATQQASSNDYIAHLENRVRAEEAAALHYRHQNEHASAQAESARQSQQACEQRIAELEAHLAGMRSEIEGILESPFWQRTAALRALLSRLSS